MSGSIASASYATIATTAATASYAATASSADNLTVRNTLTAQTLVVQTITSSVEYSSGSNVFGNVVGNTHQFTGSVLVSGSMNVNANSLVVNSNGTVSIGNTNSTYNLDVNGTGRFSGALSANSNLTVAGLIYGKANTSYPSTSLGYYAIKTNNLDAERGGITIQVSNSTSTFIDALTMNYTGAATFSSSVTAGGNYLLNNPSASKKGYTYQSPASNWGPQVSGLYFTPDDAVNAHTTFSIDLWNGSGNVITPFTIAPSGAATFSSSVLASGGITANNAGTTSLYVANTNLSAGSTTGTTGIWLGDVGSGVNTIERLKLSVNTSATILYHEYGYNVQERVAYFDHSGATIYSAGNSALYVSSAGSSFPGSLGVGVSNPSYRFHMNGGQFFLGPTSLYSSYTGDGLWGSTAAPSLLGSAAQVGSYSKFGVGGILVGYQDNGSGLYSPAYGFEVKSTDGRPVTGNVVKAIIMRDTDTGTLVFYVNNNGNVLNANNSYGSTSDISIKENITDATPKLSDLLNVKIRNYNLKADPNGLKQIGVVAQELEEVFPGMVETDTEGLKSVKYSIFVPMLVKAIQELKTQNDDLQQQINELKAQ